jgi:RNA polymerase sigma factor (sigma-70 family)
MSRHGVVTVDLTVVQLPDPDPTSDPLQALIAEEDQHEDELRQARLNRMLRRLPLLERRVIRWHYGLAGEPLSDAEIAGKLNMTRSGVWRIRQRALVRLESSEEVAGLEAV